VLVTTMATLDPSAAPKLMLRAGYTYTITTITYGPFPPNGIASQLTKQIRTPDTMSDQYEIEVVVVAGGPWPDSPTNAYYLISSVELKQW